MCKLHLANDAPHSFGKQTGNILLCVYQGASIVLGWEKTSAKFLQGVNLFKVKCVPLWTITECHLFHIWVSQWSIRKKIIFKKVGSIFCQSQKLVNKLTYLSRGALKYMSSMQCNIPPPFLLPSPPPSNICQSGQVILHVPKNTDSFHVGRLRFIYLFFRSRWQLYLWVKY